MDKTVKINVMVKSTLFLYLFIVLINGKSLPFTELILLLIIIAGNIYKEKYNDASYILVVLLALTSVITVMNSLYAILYVIVCYDFTLKKAYLGLLITSVSMVIITPVNADLLLTLILALFSVFLAEQVRQGKKAEQRFNEILDNERRLRYELESAKLKLIQSSKEIASIAEVKERNRIARDIHDSIGHSMAGILIQLQAAHKVHKQDANKAMDILHKCITSLADAVKLLRDTVHNIKPTEKVGVEYIQSILDNFSYCPVQFKSSGDINSIPVTHFEIIVSNIKEALTNAARYSQATKVELQLEVKPMFTRLYIKDNGVGCQSITEGLGLSGMRERVTNIGGSFSVSSQAGFLIVCVLPKEEGSVLFEGLSGGR